MFETLLLCICFTIGSIAMFVTGKFNRTPKNKNIEAKVVNTALVENTSNKYIITLRYIKNHISNTTTFESDVNWPIGMTININENEHKIRVDEEPKYPKPVDISSQNIFKFLGYASAFFAIILWSVLIKEKLSLDMNFVKCGKLLIPVETIPIITVSRTVNSSYAK